MSATRSTAVKRISISDLQVMRDKGQPITMVTAYDYPSARIVDQAGLPIILVGDSLGMVVLGYDSTIPVTVDDMIHHGKAVVRGVIGPSARGRVQQHGGPARAVERHLRACDGGRAKQGREVSSSLIRSTGCRTPSR